MFGGLFRWITGRRTFSVDVELRTRAVEILMREGIKFRSIKPCAGAFRFVVYGNDVRACSRVLSGNGIPYVAGTYRGAIPAVRYFLHRPGLILGALLFFTVNFLSSHVVWDITVSGNETMPANAVIEILEESGFTYGTYIPAVDFDALHSRIMAYHPEIAWISVNVSGTVADVQMRETKFGENKKREKGVYSNIKAAEDGRLVEFRVEGGYPVRSSGDVVKKGQLLVSGVVPVRDGSMRFSYPSGEVLAEVERSVTIRSEFRSSQKLYTGNAREEYTVKFFKKKINLFSNGGKEYDSYDKIESEERVFLFGSVPLPVWIEKTRLNEYVRAAVERTPREVIEEAFSELRYETELLVGDGELLRKKTECNVDDNGVTLSCRLLVLADIAEILEFRVE